MLGSLFRWFVFGEDHRQIDSDPCECEYENHGSIPPLLRIAHGGASRVTIGLDSAPQSGWVNQGVLIRKFDYRE